MGGLTDEVFLPNCVPFGRTAGPAEHTQHTLNHLES